MTVDHDGTVASVYNGYRGDAIDTEDYHFPGVWYLPQFAGEMGGEWTIHFEDSAFSGPMMAAVPFPITEWCITFLDPATTTPLTEGEWAATDTGLVSGATADTETYGAFEMQIDDIVDASGQTPWLELDVTPADANVQIDLVGPDGSVIEVKSMYETDVPSAVLLEDLVTTWLTGRWALRVTEYTIGAATVNAWSIHLGDEPPVTDGGVDGGVDSGT
ncbi:MAG: hypothetical protein M0R80_31005 [Proteobacteria bacterium]|jgi:hypothetical protein|nr:hypothetical protein [Pseudomonadota bacterium]